MSYNRMLIILSITMITIIICLCGASYAYYVLSNASTSFSTTTTSIDLGVDVVYAQSQFINTTTGAPITAEEVATKSAKSLFTVTAGQNLAGHTVAIEILLSDIVIDNTLKDSEFKIQLLEGGNVVSTKTGADIGNNNSIMLKDSTPITVGTTYNYELRIWINDNNHIQNNMMNKHFSGRIEIATIAK